MAKAPQRTELADAVDAIEDILKREVIMGEAERVATSLWIAHTFVYPHFKLTPRPVVHPLTQAVGSQHCCHW